MPSGLELSVLIFQDLSPYGVGKGAKPVGKSTAGLAAFSRSEVEKYAKIVKASGAKPDQ